MEKLGVEEIRILTKAGISDVKEAKPEDVIRTVAECLLVAFGAIAEQLAELAAAARLAVEKKSEKVN